MKKLMFLFGFSIVLMSCGHSTKKVEEIDLTDTVEVADTIVVDTLTVDSAAIAQ